jgi:hypothetical protein
MTRSRLRIGVSVVPLLATALIVVAVRTPPKPRPRRVFDVDRMADLELDMWQAYYPQENVRIFVGLLTTLREHDGYGSSGGMVSKVSRGVVHWLSGRVSKPTIDQKKALGRSPLVWFFDITGSGGCPLAAPRRRNDGNRVRKCRMSVEISRLIHEYFRAA